MQKNKLWFTFVELIAVISIISIISIFWVSSFLTNQKKAIFKQELDNINKTILDNNKDIWRNITDYEMNFYTSQNFYTITQNKLYKNVLQSMTFNSSTWTLTTTATWWTLEVNIFENNKLKDTKMINATWSLDYSFSGSINYTLKSKIWSVELNPISINRYSINSEFWASSDITLKAMTWSVSWTIYSFTWITLKNDITKAREISSNWNIIDNMTLYFEKDWTELNLNIQK